MMGQVAIIGTGVTAAGWVARFALMGWTVRVFDPTCRGRSTIDAAITSAQASLPALYDLPLPPMGAVSFHDRLSDAVAEADWIQECLPEVLAQKQKIIQSIQEHSSHDALIGSSTTVVTPKDLQAKAVRPERVFVTQAIDPVYLIPLVDLVASKETPAHLLCRAEAILRGIGMAPLTTRCGGSGAISARMQTAIRQAAQQLIAERAATPQQIADAIRLGLGLRWVQTGLLEAQPDDGAGEDRQLMAVPSGELPVDTDIVRHRDDVLVSILRVLKDRGAGAGAILRDHETKLGLPVPDPDQPEMPVTLDRQVPVTWVDYNGHMNEARFLQAFSNACDQLLEWAGMTQEAIAAGHSVFTVETHLRHLDEVQIGDRIRVTARVIEGGGKKFHIWQELRVGDTLCATCEQLLLHVDLTSRRSAIPPAQISTWLRRASEAHAALPLPAGFGRSVAAKS